MGTEVRSLQDRLDELVVARSADRRMLSIRGLEDGLAYRKVRCERHKVALNWLSAFSHLDRTESSHRFQTNDPSARLHTRGDLVAVDPDVPHIWPVEVCNHCDRQIVWASTPTGGRLPVDALPDPVGDVALTSSPGGGESPLAMFLSSTSRLEVDDASVFHRHACSQSSTARRRTRRRNPSSRPPTTGGTS